MFLTCIFRNLKGSEWLLCVQIFDADSGKEKKTIINITEGRQFWSQVCLILYITVKIVLKGLKFWWETLSHSVKPESTQPKSYLSLFSVDIWLINQIISRSDYTITPAALSFPSSAIVTICIKTWKLEDQKNKKTLNIQIIRQLILLIFFQQ